jgi:glycosyltransferase involved in cell wall biosynthesis
MKTVIIFNTINRPEMVKTTMVNNILNAGTSDIEICVTNNGGPDATIRAIRFLKEKVPPRKVHAFFNPENVGNSASLNQMLKFIDENIPDVGYIAKLDDDIELKPGWLSEAKKKFNQMRKLSMLPGLCGFNWGNLKKDREPFNTKIQCYTPARVFGSWVFPFEIFKKLGYFVELSKYGLWDSEFNNRLLTSGFVNFYLEGYDSNHIGADAGTHSDYRHMKNEELKKASRLYEKIITIRPSRIDWDKRKFWEK